MHGRIARAGASRPCEGCPHSSECPAADSAGAAGECGIDITVRVLHRGDRLFRAGETFDSLYMVRSGIVKSCIPSGSGDETVLGFHASGDLVGADAIHDGRHPSGAVVLDTSSVCRLPYAQLCRPAARAPWAQRRLFSKMSQRIRDDERRLAMLAQRNAGRRMASFLASLAAARRARGLKSDEIPLPMPRADVASYLVLAVETVSRVLTRLHEAGVIDVGRNHIRILDEEALRAIAGNMEPEAIRARTVHRSRGAERKVDRFTPLRPDRNVERPQSERRHAKPEREEPSCSTGRSTYPTPGSTGAHRSEGAQTEVHPS